MSTVTKLVGNDSPLWLFIDPGEALASVVIGWLVARYKHHKDRNGEDQ